MEQWKNTFLEKLNKAQSHWVKRFEETLDTAFVPAFEEHKRFLVDNGFRLTTPLREPGRRSFKFELAENAYVLLILRSAGVGEFELRCETFVPGAEPMLTKSVVRLADLDESWATQRLQAALDGFVNALAEQSTEPVEELVAL